MSRPGGGWVRVAAWAACATWVAAVSGNPTGEQVIAGTAQFERSGGSLQIVTSDRSIIHWQDFSIGSGEITRFIQPSASSASLNRVVSGNPSSLQGQLLSNGQVYLINPNGILVGPHGVVNTAGFVASTLDVSNDSFLKNADLTFSGDSAAAIRNAGSIRADSGDVVLIARQIENTGSIDAPKGTAGLAAGTEVLLARTGEERVFVKPTVSGGAKSGTGIQQAGAISAARAELKANGNLYALAINNGGIVRASGYAKQGGRVLLVSSGGKIANGGTISARSSDGTGGRVRISAGHVADRSTSVEIRGTVDASATDDVPGAGSPRKGGRIDLDADRIGLLDQAKLDVHGRDAGGQIFAGGGWHGTGPTASILSVGPNASLDASATGRGNGGEVVLWSDSATLFAGTISARGGAAGGNGGRVEVSSKGPLGFDGSVDLSAPAGTPGTLSLDPRTIVIGASGADDAQANDAEILFADGPGSVDPNTFFISEAKLESLTGNIILQAQEDLQIVSLIDNVLNLTNASSVTMQAGRHLGVADPAFQITANGPIHLEADSPHSPLGGGDGVGTLTVGPIASNDHDVTLIGADFNLQGSIANGAGTVRIGRSVNGAPLALGSAPGAVLTDAELDRIVGWGQVILGEVHTAGSDGAGTGAVTLTAGDITIGGLTQPGKPVMLVASGTINDTADGVPAYTSNSELSLFAGGAIGNANPEGLNVRVNNLRVNTLADARITGHSTMFLGDSSVAGLLDLRSSGTLGQTGSVRADELRVNSGGSVIFALGGNEFNTLGASQAVGSLEIVDSAGGLTVAGPVQSGQILILQTPGTLALQSDLQARGLNLSGHGILQDSGTSMIAQDLQVFLDAQGGDMNLGGLVQSASAIRLLNARNLTLNDVTGVGQAFLVGTAADDVTVNGTVFLPGGLTLIAGNDFVNNGVIQALISPIVLVADNDFPTAPGVGDSHFINNGLIQSECFVQIYSTCPMNTKVGTVIASTPFDVLVPSYYPGFAIGRNTINYKTLDCSPPVTPVGGLSGFEEAFLGPYIPPRFPGANVGGLYYAGARPLGAFGPAGPTFPFEPAPPHLGGPDSKDPIVEGRDEAASASSSPEAAPPNLDLASGVPSGAVVPKNLTVGSSFNIFQNEAPPTGEVLFPTRAGLPSGEAFERERGF